MDKKINKKTKRWMSVGIVSMLLIIFFIIFLFFGIFIPQYNRSVLNESSSHLEEIADARVVSIENFFTNDWDIARSCAYSVGDGIKNDEEILAYAIRIVNDWGYNHFCIYTESGYAFNETGYVIQTDIAEQMLADLGEKDRIAIKRSNYIEYVQAVKNSVSYNGQQIKAISLVRNVTTLLDDMGLKSFDGKAFAYLTDYKGMRISSTSHEFARPVFNLLSKLEEGVNNFFKDDCEDVWHILEHNDTVSFIHTDNMGEFYCIANPINGVYEDNFLFYFVPVKIVNKTMSDYSYIVLAISFAVVLFIVFLTVFIFVILYRLYSKKMNAELVSRDHLFNLLISQTQNVFGLVRKNNAQFAYLSPNAHDLFGEYIPLIIYTDEGVDFEEQFRENEEIKKTREALIKWDMTSPFVSGFMSLKTSDAEKYISIKMYPNKQDPNELIAVAQDVTEERRREQFLTDTYNAAETANKAKSTFLANISHDIRTPLNAIINITRFIKEGSDDPEKNLEYVAILEKSSTHLLRLVNDVLDVSRIESNKLVIENEPLDIIEIVNFSSNITGPLFAAKNQNYKLSVDSDSISVYGDRTKLSQIFTNLLNNASKFTQYGGEISFTVTKGKAIKGRVCVVFEVKDSGIGISKEYLNKIFDPFIREGNRNINEEGAGLGLSIVKNFVEAMGGTISVESEVGKGSLFKVELYFSPCVNSKTAETEAVAVEGNYDFGGIKTLVAEDNFINRKVIQMVLSKLNLDVVMVTNGRELLDTFAASAPNEYKLILTDIFMPVMDGYEATEQIRALQRSDAKDVLIIAVSANVFAEDYDKGARCGMDDYVGKPIDIDAIAAVLKKHLKQEK